MICLTFSNAFIRCSSQTNWIFLASNCRIGLVASDKFGENFDKKVTIPRNVSSSAFLVGGGISLIAETLCGSGSNPSVVSICPKYFTLDTATCNLGQKKNMCVYCHMLKKIRVGRSEIIFFLILFFITELKLEGI